MKISTTKFNEVNPLEIGKLLKAGGKLIKSKYANGEWIGTYLINDKYVPVYSDDSIKINDVILPLSIGGTYDRFIDINIIEGLTFDERKKRYKRVKDILKDIPVGDERESLANDLLDSIWDSDTDEFTTDKLQIMAYKIVVGR